MIVVDWFSFFLGVALANGIYLIGQLYTTHFYKPRFSQFIEKSEDEDDTKN